jgi:hypothetical protein
LRPGGLSLEEKEGKPCAKQSVARARRGRINQVKGVGPWIRGHVDLGDDVGLRAVPGLLVPDGNLAPNAPQRLAG